MTAYRFALRVSVLALLSVLPGVAGAESLSEAVQMTVDGHPKVGAVANDRRAVDEELTQAHGLYRPEVDLRGDMGLGWSKRWGYSGAAVDDNDILGYFGGQLTLRQMLFDGFDADSEVARQENRVKSASHRVRETSELTGLDATEAYLNVLRSRQTLESADDNLRAHRALQASIAKRQRGGAGTKGDVEQANARVAQAEAARIQIEGDLRDAEARYNSLVGQFPGDLTRPAVPMDFMPASLDDAVGSALAENPTVDIRKSDIDVAAADIEQAKASYYPRVDLEGNASRVKDLSGVRTTKDEVTTGLVMRWNLYRGGADVAREREFTWRKAEAESELDATRRETEARVRRAWAARDAARGRAEKYAQQVNANKAVLVAYKKQFEAGDRTLLDVLDAQNELFLSTTNMVSSYYTALLGDYQVLAERGALLPSLGVALPASASVVAETE